MILKQNYDNILIILSKYFDNIVMKFLNIMKKVFFIIKKF